MSTPKFDDCGLKSQTRMSTGPQEWIFNLDMHVSPQNTCRIDDVLGARTQTIAVDPTLQARAAQVDNDTMLQRAYVSSNKCPKFDTVPPCSCMNQGLNCNCKNSTPNPMNIPACPN